MCHQINQHEERGWISLQRRGLSARQLSNGRAFWRCQRWGRHESTQSRQSRRLRASFTEHRRQREVGRPRASHQHKSDACEAYGCDCVLQKKGEDCDKPLNSGAPAMFRQSHLSLGLRPGTTCKLSMYCVDGKLAGNPWLLAKQCCESREWSAIVAHKPWCFIPTGPLGEPHSHQYDLGLAGDDVLLF